MMEVIPKTFILLLLMNFHIIQLSWVEPLNTDSENKTLLNYTITDCFFDIFNAKTQNDLVW